MSFLAKGPQYPFSLPFHIPFIRYIYIAIYLLWALDDNLFRLAGFGIAEPGI